MIFSAKSFSKDLFSLGQYNDSASKRTLFLFVGVLLAIGSLSAQNTWTGGINNSWNIAGNWSAGVPDANDDVTISFQFYAPVIGAGITAFAKSVVIAQGGTLALNATATLIIDGTPGGSASLSNGGSLVNNGIISIGATVGSNKSGLINNGTFNNTVSGLIQVDRAGVYAIASDGYFTNTGRITVGGITTAGNQGISNFGEFVNYGDGEIRIDRCATVGLFNTNSAVFANDGKIFIGSVGDITGPGIANLHNFNNNATGEITIDRATRGIYNYGAITNGLIANAGKMTIGASIPFAVENTRTINNTSCGELIISGIISNSSAFTNAGLFRVSTTSPHTNTALTNNGIIEYPLGNPIPNVTNNDVILQDLSGSCGTYFPALQIGGANSFTAASTWYKDAALTMVAGTYNQATNTFTATNLPGTGTYTLFFNTTDNVNGCAKLVSLDISVSNDNTPPTVVCKNATVNLGVAGAGNITMATVFQSGSDNCGTVNLVSVAPNTFTCSNLGLNTVTLTVNDGHSNNATCTAIVTVTDNTPPTVACKNATVNLSAAGTGSITTATVFQLGGDNCGTLNLVSVSPNSFTCSNVGTNTVILTVNDGHGNTNTCTATVTITDDNNACAPLPVELVNLTVIADKDAIQLNWQTASERTNAGFQVERSENGRNFEKIAFVNGAGTSAEKHTYQLKDKEVRAGQIYFYRLQQIDYDGRVQYSDIVQARVASGKLTLIVFPNPAPTNSIVQIQLYLPEIAEIALVLFDAQGRIIHSEQHDLEANDQVVQMQTGDLPAATYFLKATVNGISNYQNIVITQ